MFFFRNSARSFDVFSEFSPMTFTNRQSLTPCSFDRRSLINRFLTTLLMVYFRYHRLVPRLCLGTPCLRGSASRVSTSNPTTQQAEPALQPVPRQSLGTRTSRAHAAICSPGLMV